MAASPLGLHEGGTPEGDLKRGFEMGGKFQVAFRKGV